MAVVPTDPAPDSGQTRVLDLLPAAVCEFENDIEYGREVLTYFDADGGWLAHIAWNPFSGSIDSIEVHEDHQRKGVATAMWHEVLSTYCPKLRHDDDIELTDEGHAWALAIGGDNAPRRNRL